MVYGLGSTRFHMETHGAAPHVPRSRSGSPEAISGVEFTV